MLLKLLLGLSLWAQSSPFVSADEILNQSPVDLKLQGVDFAGGTSIGGGDTIDSRKYAAWFYGADPIQVCFHLAENFQMQDSQVRAEITQAIKTWQSYFVEKRINKNLKSTRTINTHFRLKSKCVGGEELVFYFGTGPIFGNLQDIKARQHLSRPVAYVNKTHFSSDFTFSKGYIRFVEPEKYQFLSIFGDSDSEADAKSFPNWDSGAHLYNIILHELGHVLGFVHTPGTVMKKTIATLDLLENHDVPKLSIDGEKELFPCLDCVSTYRAKKDKKNIFRKIQIQKNDEVLAWVGKKKVRLNLVRTLMTQKSKSLVSLFSPQDSETSGPKIYFIEWQGKDLVFSFEERTLDVFHKGVLVSRLKKEGAL